MLAEYIAPGGVLGKQEEGDISPSEADDGVGRAMPSFLPPSLTPSLLSFIHCIQQILTECLLCAWPCAGC